MLAFGGGLCSLSTIKQIHGIHVVKGDFRAGLRLGLMLLPRKGLFSSWHGRPPPPTPKTMTQTPSLFSLACAHMFVKFHSHAYTAREALIMPVD